MIDENRNEERQKALTSVLLLAQECHYEQGHSHQVAKLALRLFDELKDLHKLEETERFYLESAAILHDIGWLEGRKGHHKRARDIILTSKHLLFLRRERMLVALIARYHRQALPKDTHKFYQGLSMEDKSIVQRLASLLRMADGLDRRHISSVKDLTCSVFEKKVMVRLEPEDVPPLDKLTGKKKADLFEILFKRDVVII